MEKGYILLALVALLTTDGWNLSEAYNTGLSLIWDEGIHDLDAAYGEATIRKMANDGVTIAA